MNRERVAAYRARVRSELEAASDADRSARDVAASFAAGVFITALPSLGTGLILIVVFAWLFDRASKIALLAAVVVLNPIAKWGVYAASFWLGTILFGPVQGVTVSDVSLWAGLEIVARLLVGNVVIAIVFTVAGYLFALRFVYEYRRRDVDVGEFLSTGLL